MKLVAYTLTGWLLSWFLLYAIGWSIGWVRRFCGKANRRGLTSPGADARWHLCRARLRRSVREAPKETATATSGFLAPRFDEHRRAAAHFPYRDTSRSGGVRPAPR